MTTTMRDRLTRAAWKAQKGGGLPDCLFDQMAVSARSNVEAAAELRMATTTVDAILDELRVPDGAMDYAGTEYVLAQGDPEIVQHYTEVFTAMIDVVREQQ